MNYASKHLLNSGTLIAADDSGGNLPTAERILFFLKTKGPASTATLAQQLDITPEAARQQIQKLAASALVEGRMEAANGVGRPSQNWVLTEAGNDRFPDTHAQLTVQLIASVRLLFGEEGMDKLITQREQETRAVYQQACTGSSWQQRLQQLALVRSSEGYMARAETDGDDGLLIEDHCPICAAARTCQGFCRSELNLFQEIIGNDASVIREQHLLAGAGRCVYRIVPVQK
ncbi:helix-turn-helix transcriptional regulator [Janthinobacterium agaricidamnosum]|uniref:HTH domain protein n=1 Tax=Janthinobacterium agaricidamnosum NBRC 102515 = DSM 9628 TaxID=1349767 RepID=W0UYX3_9BURK|nr:metalloregulator ArsR/SmtB family transcription factor [Janthinobacterium agaricidamnosum]CDG80841.1 HTH domain protein [Janthinobacterium agaricidamnosum NBRC 102515 = DSM 9628]